MSDRARRVLLAADASRRGIERLLHDGVQQDLVAIVVKLQLARRLADSDPAAAVELLDGIRAETQAALDSARELALRIYPPLLDSAGLRAALQAVAPDTTIEVTLGERCPEAIAACVYFCCLELAPNASAVSVHGDGERVVFEVVGPAVADLSRVEDRVEALGGRLSFEPGRVSGVLPL